MRIALFGYGKMGKEIERIALEQGHVIVARVTAAAPAPDPFPATDVSIEFSSPEVAPHHIIFCLQRAIPVVCGTTGWLHRLPEIEQEVLRCNGSFFYASNFSIGVNLFFKLNEFLADKMKALPAYNVTLEETHHIQKKDSPSGTAITLANGILHHITRKRQWVNREEERPEELSILSHRVPEVPGTHVVRYASPVDRLELIHTAHSREGFARGALQVAEWLPGRKGVLGMNDFLQF
jgi:4-hydroxy-tetrahydrodipicolinate reductase